MDALIEAIIVMDAAGHIERFNKAAEGMFGYTAAEAIGRDISILMPDPEFSHHTKYVERYLSTRHAHIIGIGREVTARRKD